MTTEFTSKELSHLGLVSGMIDELGIVESIDQQLQISGILHMEGLSGNTDDKTAFNKTINDYVKELQAVYEIEYVVFDSAGYTAKTLQDCGTLTKWVSRVPETLKESKELICQSFDTWQPLKEGYQYIPLTSQYGNINQRWLLIFSSEAYEREIITLKKNFSQNSQKEYNSFTKLLKERFDSQSQAQKALNKFKKSCKYLSISEITFKEIPIFDKKGRPKKNRFTQHFSISTSSKCLL